MTPIHMNISSALMKALDDFDRMVKAGGTKETNQAMLKDNQVAVVKVSSKHGHIYVLKLPWF
jgi:hypothetical protein